MTRRRPPASDPREATPGARAATRRASTRPARAAASADAAAASTVSGAVDAVARQLFLPEQRRMRAFLDEPTPVAPGVACPSASTVATLLNARPPLSGQRVAVIGEPTGYLAACCAQLGCDVTVEANRPETRDRATAAWAAGARVAGVAHGRVAWGPRSIDAATDTFDHIIVGRPIDEPRARTLLERLDPGHGVLVAPTSDTDTSRLVVWARSANGVHRVDAGDLSTSRSSAANRQAG